MHSLLEFELILPMESKAIAVSHERTMATTREGRPEASEGRTANGVNIFVVQNSNGRDSQKLCAGAPRECRPAMSFTVTVENHVSRIIDEVVQGRSTAT
jgi:hypothetical protein